MASSETLPPLFEEFPPVSTAEWESKIQSDLGHDDIDAFLRWDSLDGVSLPAYLRRDDLNGIAHVDPDAPASPLAETDTIPANAWHVRQNVCHPDPEEANRLARRAAENGAPALGLVRPAHQSAQMSGRSVETVGDLRTLLDGISLGEVALHLDGGAASPALLSALTIVAKNRVHDLTGSVIFDPVAAIATGAIYDASVAFRLASDLAVTDEAPQLRTFTLDLRPYHEAGASAVQELAFGLGALSDALTRLLDRGHPLPALLSRFQVVTPVSTSYFVEIAKLRALRLLVPQVIDAFAVEADQEIEISPADLFVQAETSRRTETIYDPYVNILRGTTEAMAAVVGNCDVLSVRPYDASLRPPGAFGSRIARNVQLILREEAHMDSVSDPGAGAYYLEAATDRLAERAWATFQDLEAGGGVTEGLRSGHVQKQIEDVRRERRRAVDERDRVLVGTNHYPNLDETRLADLERPPAPAADPSLESPPDSLAAFRAALNDGHTISALLATLRDGSPSIAPLPRDRLATAIEDVRLRTEQHAEETGQVPTVLLAPLGPAAARSARATFARNMFGVAGFEVVDPLRFETPEAVAEAAEEAEADVVVLCSADAEYPDLAPALRTALDTHGLSPLLVVAGAPEDLDDLPVDDFIHRGISLREKLEAFQHRLGILTEKGSCAD